MKYCSIDIETTGLDPDTCDILEFGAVIDNLNDQKPIDTLPQFHCYFKALNYNGEPYALSMHADIFRRIADREDGYQYLTPMKFGYKFKQFLMANGLDVSQDRVTINVAGKNFGAFDLQFLNRKTDLYKHVKISHKILDPAILFIENSDQSLPCLGECKERAGMSSRVAHTAIADALDVVLLMRVGLADKFKNGEL